MSSDVDTTTAAAVPYEGPLPAVTNLNRPHWDALRDHRLLAQRCRQCATVWLPPGPWCVACWSPAFDWIELGGKATVTSWVRFHQQYYRRGPFQVPYVVAEVTLPEGPRLYAQLIGDDEPVVGLAVEICYEDVSPDLTLIRVRRAG
jgi:uncharacterized protein